MHAAELKYEKARQHRAARSDVPLQQLSVTAVNETAKEFVRQSMTHKCDPDIAVRETASSSRPENKTELGNAHPPP